MRNIPRVRLAFVLTAFCLLVVTAVVGSVVPLLLHASRTLTERQSMDVLQGRAHDAGVQLSRALYGQWFKLQQLADEAAANPDHDQLRLRFDTVKAVNPDCAWVGFADTSGRVVVAAGGILEGEQVLQRPWFRNGIEQPFAGDKHEALLLARFLAAKSDEPVRLVDLSLPVHRSDGTLAGVLGMHVDWIWVRDFLRAFGRDDGSDLLLVSRQGDVLVGPSGLEGRRLTLHSMQAAGQGVAVTDAELWPDGQQYLVSVVPDLTYRDLPSFGWSIVARQPVSLAFAPARQITRDTLPILLGVCVIAVLLSYMLGIAMGRPITRLALAAGEVARGRFTAPIPDERRYREVALLSAALSRLQSTTAAAAEPAPAHATSAVRSAVAA